VKRRALLKHLRAHGCELIREGARHSWWGHEENETRSAVPRHAEISNELIKKICKDLSIEPPASR
jgi:mRNA interferase HicA